MSDTFWQGLMTWPWHINARRHWHILYCHRHLNRDKSYKEWGMPASLEGSKKLAELEMLQRGDLDVLTARDAAMCSWWLKDALNVSEQHPLFCALQLLRQKWSAGSYEVKWRDENGYMPDTVQELPYILRLQWWIKNAVGPEYEANSLAWWIRENEPTFPSSGIYIYHHPYEGYKIGKAENVFRRMVKHLCSAPASELLYVIESSDINWAERFIQSRYDHRRRHANHEYFDLTLDDLAWLFSIKVLEPPRMGDLGAQLSLLDLL